MPAPILHEGLWFNVGHLVHTDATHGGSTDSNIFPTTLLVYRRAIYPQGMTSEYDLRANNSGVYLPRMSF